MGRAPHTLLRSSRDGFSGLFVAVCPVPTYINPDSISPGAFKISTRFAAGILMIDFMLERRAAGDAGPYTKRDKKIKKWT